MEKDILLQTITQLADVLQFKQYCLATAESCTGGWIAKLCTDLPGSSNWFECGFVTYSNRAKHDMLEVSDDTLHAYGAVSENVVAEMVRGAIANSHANVALAVSGIAGPSGGTALKPVGTVCFAWLLPETGIQTVTRQLQGDRNAIREQAVIFALRELLVLLD